MVNLLFHTYRKNVFTNHLTGFREYIYICNSLTALCTPTMYISHPPVISPATFVSNYCNKVVAVSYVLKSQVASQ